MAGAPVTAGHITYALFGNSRYDSVATAYTDALGQYKLSFDASGKGDYVIDVLYSKDLYDLTNTPYAYPWGSSKTNPGVTNKIDIEVTPYKTVTINANSNKGGKSNIDFSFVNTDKQNYFGGHVFYDTVGANQIFSFTRTIKVLPNREYHFSKVTCNIIHLYGYNYDFRDYDFENHLRTVSYNDITTVNFQ